MQESDGKFVPPRLEESAFNCPLCGAFAHQSAYALDARRMLSTDKVPDPDLSTIVSKSLGHKTVPSLVGTECARCGVMSIWRKGEIVWPRSGSAPPANADLPAPIRIVYEEASEILSDSPRAAAALLRLALEMLSSHLNVPGRNLNAKIGRMVKGGLDAEIQRALDIVRVVGNHAVHPGFIDSDDDDVTALGIFHAVNLIAEELISKPKRIQKMYHALPDRDRSVIEERDGPIGRP